VPVSRNVRLGRTRLLALAFPGAKEAEPALEAEEEEREGGGGGGGGGPKGGGV
jgi:hypothetical protein